MKIIKKSIMITFLLAVLLISITVSVCAQTYQVEEGKTRQILLDASLTTGKLTAGSWSSSNPTIAQIESQSPAECIVYGVDAGTATITNNYTYYVGGSYFRGVWSCKVTVTASSGGGGGGGSSADYYRLYFSDNTITSDLTLDLAGKNFDRSKKVTLITKPYTSLGFSKVWNDGYFYLALDVSNGWPSTVSSNDYLDLSENGSPVIAKDNITFYAKEVGKETIKFQLVIFRNEKFYNTNHGKATLNVNVICSHKFDDGVIIQELTELQNGIMEYTCTKCGEKKKELILSDGQQPLAVLPENLVYIGEDAFSGTDLVSVIVPKGVSRIESGTFIDCPFLTEIVVDETCYLEPGSVPENTVIIRREE